MLDKLFGKKKKKTSNISTENSTINNNNINIKIIDKKAKISIKEQRELQIERKKE